MHQVVPPAIQVISQLSVEIAFHLVTTEAEKREKPSHAYFPSLKINRTAAVRRFQLCLSTVSCFSPARVSE